MTSAIRGAIRSPQARRNRIAAYAERWLASPRPIPDDLMSATLYADALFLLEPRPRHSRRERSRTSSACSPCSKARWRATSIIRARVTSTSTRPSRRPSRSARRRAPSILGKLDSGREPHQPHAVAHVERGGAVGRFRAREPRGLAFGSEGAQSAKASRSIRRTTCTCSLYAASMDGQGASRMQAGEDYAELTSDSILSGADAGPVRPVRRGRGHGPRPADDIPGGLWDFAQGYAQLRRGDAATARDLSRAA